MRDLVGDRRDAGALAVVVGVGVLLLVLAWPRVSAPFGDSDEGINGAVWATNSRALRESGVVESRLGGRRLDGTSYATHPPYIVVATAAAEIVGGEEEWATRAPAWLGSIAALGLLYALARSAGAGPVAAAGATVATALTPMFFTYGTMLDTPVVAFPFGVAVLLMWLRRWRTPEGQRATSPWLTGATCAAAALTGWQAAVLVVLAAATLVARGLRGRRHWLAEAMPFVIGGALGVALSLSWTWWVYGDFATLSDKYFRRSGESGGVGVGDMVSFQIPWLAQLLGLGLIGLGSCIAALWDRRMRALAGMSLAIVVVYAVVFRQAAAGHQYWNYWALLPTAVGFAWAFDRMARDVPARAFVPVVAVACIVLGLVNLAVLDDEARRYIDDGHEVAELVLATDYPDEQDRAHYVGPVYRPDAWLAYYTGLLPVPLTSSNDVDTLAATAPANVVVVLGWCDESDAAYELCREVVGVDPPSSKPRPMVLTAGELAERETP